MKILQVVGWFFPESIGGTEVYVADLARGLQSLGHEMVVAVPAPGAANLGGAHVDDLYVVRYPIPAEPTRAEAQAEVAVRGSDRFEAFLKREKFDVVHFHTFVTGMGIWEVDAARRCGAAVVVTTHSSALGYLCQRGTLMKDGTSVCDGVVEASKCAACVMQSKGIPAWLAKWAAPVARFPQFAPGRLGTMLALRTQIESNQKRQRRMYESIDRFVLLTDAARKIVERDGAPASLLQVNRLGATLTATRKPSVQERPTEAPVRIGYFGRMDFIKGPQILAAAFKQLLSTAPLRLEFCGPAQSSEEKKVLAEIRSIVGDDRRISIVPGVGREHAMQKLASFDVLCCPSLCLEGGPLVAVEAHAVGTPVIGSAIGGLPELVVQDVERRLSPPGDISALSKLLLQIAEDPAGTVDFWRRALPKSRTMAEVIEQTLQTYVQILTEKRPR